MVVSVLRFLTLMVALSLALSSLRHTEASEDAHVLARVTRYNYNANVLILRSSWTASRLKIMSDKSIDIGVESELAKWNKNQLHSNSKAVSRCQLQLHSEHVGMGTQLHSNSTVDKRNRDPNPLQLQTKQLRTPESTPTPDRSCPSLDTLLR